MPTKPKSKKLVSKHEITVEDRLDAIEERFKTVDRLQVMAFKRIAAIERAIVARHGKGELTRK